MVCSLYGPIALLESDSCGPLSSLFLCLGSLTHSHSSFFKPLPPRSSLCLLSSPFPSHSSFLLLPFLRPLFPFAPCRVCRKPFFSSSNRIRHERKQHSTATTAAKLACLFCDKACFGQRALQLHAQSCRGIPPIAAVVAEGASSQGSLASDSAPALRRRIAQAEDDSFTGGMVVQPLHHS